MGNQSNLLAGFWGVAGFMAGIAAAFFLVPLWQRHVRPGQNAAAQPVVAEQVKPGVLRRRWLIIGAASLVFVVVAFAIYVWRGRPELSNDTTAHLMADRGADMVDAGAAAATTTPGSMDQAAAKLAMRLQGGGGSDSDWDLLKKSYEFLGDSEGAALAQQHRVKSDLQSNIQSADVSTATAAALDSTPVTQPDTTTLATKLEPYQQRVKHNANDAEAWLVIAELQRTARDFVAANIAYERVIALHQMTANAWADYADSQAAVSGTLNNDKSRAALEAALKLQPQHVKALWLKASLAHETHHYQDALVLWRQLLAVTPTDSSDYKLIEANINEASTLQSGGQSSAATKVDPATTIARISGSIVLDATLKNKVTADMTLFVFAKPSASPGPPAAVLRTHVTSWPMSFVLDDSLAMLPTRKLSQFKSVSVQARLSRSGQALPQPGDMQTDSVTVNTQASTPITLHMTQL